MILFCLIFYTLRLFILFFAFPKLYVLFLSTRRLDEYGSRSSVECVQHVILAVSKMSRFLETLSLARTDDEEANLHSTHKSAAFLNVPSPSFSISFFSHFTSIPPFVPSSHLLHV